MMKKHYKHLAILGTLCCLAALAVLWLAVLSVDWVSIQEPQLDPLELDKLGPYEEAKPHLIRAKFGLFKMCVQQQQPLTVMKNSFGTSDLLVNSQHTALIPNTGNGYGGGVGIGSSSSSSGVTTTNNVVGGGNDLGPVECINLDWYNFGIINLDPSRKPPKMPTELIANCVEKLRFTLPFIGLSVLFTSMSFLCITFGYFCQKNKKIIEATLLILAGLCQATALLTFVSQIGSEFEANLPYSSHEKRLTTFYRYKYGYSFYLFLLSFSLSELAALFDMAAYFRKYPPNHYVITFHRQEPSPFMPGSTRDDSTAATGTSNNTGNTSALTHNSNNSHYQSNYHSESLRVNNHHHHLSQQQQQHSYYPNNTNTFPYNHHHSSHHTYSQYPVTSSAATLPKHQHTAPYGLPTAPPDLCNDYIHNSSDLILHHQHHTTTGLSTNRFGGGVGNGGAAPTAAASSAGGGNNLSDDMSNNCTGSGPLPPPQSFMNPEVTITTIERTNGCYGTLRNNKLPTSSPMESFGTMRKENNI